jgi:hypothetical protein
MANTCKHSGGLPVSIKYGKFLHQISDYQLLKEDSAP